MTHHLRLYNALHDKKEIFEPLHPPHVGLYVCGPTVYKEAHIGNVRTFLCFDILYRYLQFLGYKVRYVRNITDVGHLVDDNDQKEDKIEREAKIQKVEPMEIVHTYTRKFHHAMQTFGILPPHIEPSATAHIPEQITFIQQLIQQQYAYEKNGSVYFDLENYQKKYAYGTLSRRVIQDLYTHTRALQGQDDKKNPLDFVLWKKASPKHLMRWSSPWSDGIPGWHLECSTMSAKYLGQTFDIHGGGIDLKFPHHECERAQSIALHHQEPVRYWLYVNMLTVHAEKMSKSKGNALTLDDFFTGKHPLLPKAYDPMTLRCFMLQAHYRNPLDISQKALDDAQKAHIRLVNATHALETMHFPTTTHNHQPDNALIQDIQRQCQDCHNAINDDLNTATLLAALFQLMKKINALHTGQLSFEQLDKTTFQLLKTTFLSFTKDILGLGHLQPPNSYQLLETILQLYTQAKHERNNDTILNIREQLKNLGISLQDMKKNTHWAFKEP